MKSERLILLSGGIDSFVRGHMLSAKGWDVSSLFINYGQAAYPHEQTAADAQIPEISTTATRKSSDEREKR